MPQPDLFRLPRKPWNTGRIIGPKAPLKPKHIWAIRQQLKASKRVRDLAMFTCALDAKLRACDLIKLTVSDVAPGGVLRERSTVIQQKAGRPVPFEITEPTRDALQRGWPVVVTGTTVACSRAAADPAHILARANTLALSMHG